ncbi:hypothetical protein PFMG_03254 [Plasmodium falciparum IGH-CR14]|uniref:RAP domain-containing protein n=1 Tax=Plasmodium falciparum IGH-CR14 TaxID=580059 RepID=A0A0L1ICW5_PLAFA|nr:hypothetical protein PFMG_03254 [Plasmodium falciparum IGH-CR14]
MIKIKCLGSFPKNINKVSLSFYCTKNLKNFSFLFYHHIKNKKKETPIYPKNINNKLSYVTYEENIRIKEKKQKKDYKDEKDEKDDENHKYITKKKCHIKDNHIIYPSQNLKKLEKNIFNKKIKDNIMKSDIINLINNIKNVQNGNVKIINELINIILHINYNINAFFNLKKKYVIGFLWSMVKTINIIEQQKLFKEKIITLLKYFFIFLSNKVIQKNLLESSYHPVDIKQFIFSILNIKLNENEITKIDSIKIHDLVDFIKYLQSYPYKVNVSHKNEKEPKLETNIFYHENNEEEQKIKNNNHIQSTDKQMDKLFLLKKNYYNENNHYEHSNYIYNQIHNNLLPLFQECINVRSVIYTIYSYICDKIKIIDMEIKTVIDFLELANKNCTNVFSYNISNILLYKIEQDGHKYNDNNNKNDNYDNNNYDNYDNYDNNYDNNYHHNIYHQHHNNMMNICNFSIFELCRFINIIINNNIKHTNKFICSIVNILLYEQYYKTKDTINYYNFNQCLSHLIHKENVDIQNYKDLQVCVPKYLCNTWLYKATPRDIASLIRDFSRLKFINNHFYNILIEAFFFKTDQRKGRHTIYNKNIDGIQIKENHNNNHNNKKIDGIQIKENHNNNHNNKKIDGIQIKENHNNNHNNKNNNHINNVTICCKKITTQCSSKFHQNFQLEDIRNYVDILTALCNINYTYDKYINLFINKLIKDEKNSILFFNKKNIQNVVITFRNLLLLTYKENDIINKMTNFIISYNNYVDIKQLIMIYYSLYNYINKIYHMENIKYVGNPSQIFSIINEKENNITHTKNETNYINTTNNYNKQHMYHHDMFNVKYNKTKDKEHHSSFISIEYIKKNIFQYMYKLLHIILTRKKQIDSLQGLANLYYATSFSINNLSVPMYHFFYEHFFYILNIKKGKENVILQTVVQIFLFHYKNNIVHKTFLISLLNLINYKILIDLHNLCTITSIAYHFNIINQNFLNLSIHFLNKEINKIENIEGHTTTDDTISITINEKKEKKKNYIYENYENKKQMDVLYDHKQDDIYKYDQLNNTNINNIKNLNHSKINMINVYNEKNDTNNMYHTNNILPTNNIYHTNNILPTNNIYPTNNICHTNKVIKCIFFLVTNNTFLNTSIRNFIKILILLKKLLKKKIHFDDEEYKIIHQIFLYLNIYCKKKENEKKYMNHKRNSTNNHDIHFYIQRHFFIPYTILKDVVKRNIVSHKKVHISSFQYKLSDYFNKKKIKYRSEYYLKQGLIVDFLILKNNKPFLLLEIDGIYHFNISTDVSDYDIIHNNMLLLKNGRTLFRNHILESFDHLKFLSIPWFFFLQTQWIKNLDLLLNKNGLL